LGTNGSLGKGIDSGWWQTGVKALDKARKPGELLVEKNVKCSEAKIEAPRC